VLDALSIHSKQKGFRRQKQVCCALYPVYTIKQTSSKYEACIEHNLHEAIINRTSSKCQANIKAWFLLNVSLMFAWSCIWGIIHVRVLRF